MRWVRHRLSGTAPLAATLYLTLLMGLAPRAPAGLTLREVCEVKGEVARTSIDLDLFTGPEIAHQLPGPSATDFGDQRIGTADDGLHPGLTVPPQPGFPAFLGCPNELSGRGNEIPGLHCGVPGSPGTRRLHGTRARDSQESTLHGPETDQLDLSRDGHGAYSFIKATVGDTDTILYLTGTATIVVTGFDGTFVEIQLVNVTFGGTPLAPLMLFDGPVNADLITIGPGDDLKFHGVREDERGETIVSGCNGLAPGVDEVGSWLPTSRGPFPKFPDVRHGNRGRWNLASDPERGGRLFTERIAIVTKVPSSEAFFVQEEEIISGYIFPIDEAEALLFDVFRRDARVLADLPDIPGFPDSGRNLAAYFVEVIVPKARESRANRLVAFFRGETSFEILGIDVFFDFTLVGGMSIGKFDMCRLDVRPCTF